MRRDRWRGFLWCGQDGPPRGRRGRSLLFHRRGNSGALLCVPDVLLDEIHVIGDDLFVHAFLFELGEERSPGRINVGRCKALFWVITHVCDVDERAGLRSGDHGFIDLAAFACFLLLLNRRFRFRKTWA
jgi:hypothetical protein